MRFHLGVNSGAPQEPYVTCEGATLRAKGASPGHAWELIYSKLLNSRQNQYGTDANWDGLDGVHIGATW